MKQTAPACKPTAQAGAPSREIICIGSSTGGPAALAALLSSIRKPLSAPILIVQHMDEPFFQDLAVWLSETTGQRVQLAQEGSLPRAGEVLLAARAQHLSLLPSGRLHYLPLLPGEIHCPSVDVFFSSVAVSGPPTGSAVILTGMGRDGAAGLLKLRQRGYATLAQTQSTCVVYGMPKAAAERGAVQQSLSPEQIGCWLSAQHCSDRSPVCPPAPKRRARFNRAALHRIIAAGKAGGK